MSDHEPHTQPTEPNPPAEPAAVRRFRRSESDRVVGGVAGGLAAHLGVDPVLVRLAFVAFIAIGGGGLLLYALCWFLVPTESAPERGALADRRAAFRTALVVVAVLAAGASALVGGFVLSGFGGAVAAAVVVLVLGLTLVLLAFAGPGGRRAARLAALPALALALGASVPAAADIDLNGGFGERTLRPTSAGDVPAEVRAGAGRLVVDLRDVELPPGDTPLAIELGIGEVRVLLPDDACAVADLRVGAGLVEWFGSETGGVDVEQRETVRQSAGAGGVPPRLVLRAHVGTGHLVVDDREATLFTDALPAEPTPSCG